MLFQSPPLFFFFFFANLMSFASPGNAAAVVHERTMDADMLLLLLKLSLRLHPRLRLVVMSATLQPSACGRLLPIAFAWT